LKSFTKALHISRIIEQTISPIRKKMQKLTFELNSEFVEVNQLLKLSGLVDSGGAGKNLVASGVVSVDGKKELRKTAKIRAGQTVSVGDVRISVIAGNGDAT
jgi:ribosome-associated protein